MNLLLKSSILTLLSTSLSATANANVCVETGENAAELVILENWCQPSFGTMSSYPSAEKRCRDVAIRTCRNPNTLLDIIYDWCPDKPVTSFDLDELKDYCRSTVDGLIDKPPTPSPPNPKCVGDSSPNSITRSGSNNGNGSRFAFRLLNNGNEQCIDNRGRVYSWGMFDKIRSFEDCAVECVKESPIELINDGVFRGFDFDCKNSQCMCLFDAGEIEKLSNNKRSVFRDTNRGGKGVKSVNRDHGLYAPDVYCGSLVGFMDEEADFKTSRRVLRGSTD